MIFLAGESSTGSFPCFKFWTRPFSFGCRYFRSCHDPNSILTTLNPASYYCWFWLSAISFSFYSVGISLPVTVTVTVTVTVGADIELAFSFLFTVQSYLSKVETVTALLQVSGRIQRFNIQRSNMPSGSDSRRGDEETTITCRSSAIG